ncbi:MAG: glycosyltransferase, partial [Candidatus Margulisbacteria bacterium]|nr:glycosyltransferase [Candidatus Margulisiibacteriota bacterium]
MNKTLSLCIPTYNRAAILGDYLKELAPQAAKYDVNIYISDNASTDETEQVVISLMGKYPNIYYSRNDKDMGHEYNFMKVLR